jgi:hypothetical protein
VVTVVQLVVSCLVLWAVVCDVNGGHRCTVMVWRLVLWAVVCGVYSGRCCTAGGVVSSSVSRLLFFC